MTNSCVLYIGCRACNSWVHRGNSSSPTQNPHKMSMGCHFCGEIHLGEVYSCCTYSRKNHNYVHCFDYNFQCSAQSNKEDFKNKFHLRPLICNRSRLYMMDICILIVSIMEYSTLIIKVADAVVCETLFFVTVSTSSRGADYQVWHQIVCNRCIPLTSCHSFLRKQNSLPCSNSECWNWRLGHITHCTWQLSQSLVLHKVPYLDLAFLGVILNLDFVFLVVLYLVSHALYWFLDGLL